MQDYNNIDNSMLELVFAPAAKWISRSDDDIIQGRQIIFVVLPDTFLISNLTP